MNHHYIINNYNIYHQYFNLDSNKYYTNHSIIFNGFNNS